MHVTGGEKILYDFNLLKGDTFHAGDPNLVQDFYVNLVDTIQMLNGDFRKRFYLEAINPIDENSDANHIIWIEDIGNINGLMTNSNPWTVGWRQSTLLCMYWDATLVYDDPNHDGCWLLTTATNEIDKQKIYFIPNPATEEITLIGFEGEIENIKIYDTNGRLLFQGNSTTIKLNDFPSGYYYAMVLIKNSQVMIVGFVKS